MLFEPECYKRKCKHYQGVIQADETEATERNVCLAFPGRIPDEIAYGDNDHFEPLDNQGNEIVYEEETEV